MTTQLKKVKDLWAGTLGDSIVLGGAELPVLCRFATHNVGVATGQYCIHVDNGGTDFIFNMPGDAFVPVKVLSVEEALRRAGVEFPTDLVNVLRVAGLKIVPINEG